VFGDATDQLVPEKSLRPLNLPIHGAQVLLALLALVQLVDLNAENLLQNAKILDVTILLPSLPVLLMNLVLGDVPIAVTIQ
jgi:hypothetical protein